MGWLEYVEYVSFWDSAYFQVRTASFREGNIQSSTEFLHTYTSDAPPHHYLELAVTPAELPRLWYGPGMWRYSVDMLVEKMVKIP